MNPVPSPIACELFRQWQRARGGRTDPALRPFSRWWEDLLADAGLVSATERNDAERDIHALAADNGWVELKPVRNKRHLVERVVMPLNTEARWREAFGFVPPSDDEARQIREFTWESGLDFVRESRLNLSFAELRQLNEFLKQGGRERVMVPIKERSLKIFGDEKRLDLLLSSTLFRQDRLNLMKDLRCEVIGVPLAWKRGPSRASAQPLIVLENAATWHSYCRWNNDRNLFSAVVYGDGNRFADGIRYLADVFYELGGPRRVLYFGDLDQQGLVIPQEASCRAHSLGFPAVEPHLWSYRHLLTLGAGHGQPWESEPPSATLCDWLQTLAEPARHLFAIGHRLAQEHIGWEFLRGVNGSD
ncbi:MAG: Wadjet anti-phage system protein JetD domain-containing protein [Verrucomicrobiota bacterium]